MDQILHVLAGSLRSNPFKGNTYFAHRHGTPGNKTESLPRYLLSSPLRSEPIGGARSTCAACNLQRGHRRLTPMYRDIVPGRMNRAYYERTEGPGRLYPVSTANVQWPRRKVIGPGTGNGIPRREACETDRPRTQFRQLQGEHRLAHVGQ